MKIKVFINVDWFAISHFSVYLANLVKTANLVKVYALDTGFGKKISNLGAEFHPIKLSRENSGIFSELKSILEIYMDLRKENTDIIECFTIKPSLIIGMLNLFFGIKSRIVLYITGLGTIVNSQNLFGKLKKFIFISIYKLIALRKNINFIVENKDDADLLIYGTSIKSDRISLIPGTGVDLNIFKPAPTFSLNNNKTVLMVSRLLKEKGIEILDDAAGYVLKKHKNINFLVAGEIDESSPSSYKFSDLEKFKNLNFLGRQSDVHNTMSKADIFVHPTYYREGFPRVLMEASASGLPIITTDIQGCRDAIINRVTGLIVPPKNSKVLADAIISLINNCTLRNKLGFNARAHAEIYFAEDILSKKHVNATLGIIQI